MRSHHGVLAGLGLIALLAIAILGGGALAGAPPPVRLPGVTSADELDAWVDHALAIAMEESDEGAARPEDWQPAQVETCGDTAVAFYSHDRRGHYLWAMGRPAHPIDRSIETGTAISFGDPEVARLRALLPVCEMALGSNQPSENTFVREDAIRPQQVVSVPLKVWQFGGEFVVPITKAPNLSDGDASVQIPAFIYGRVDDARVRAVDVITTDGRLRYTVEAPGFEIQVDFSTALRFELLDAAGTMIAAGSLAERSDIVQVPNVGVQDVPEP